MNKFFILLVSVMLLSSINANGQRPIGDTIPVGSGDYLYTNFHDSGSYRLCILPSRASLDDNYYFYLDWYYMVYNRNLWNMLMGDGQMTYNEVLLLYPGIGWFNGRHITGQEFTRNDELMVRGLAVCPTISDVSRLASSPLENTWPQVQDTSIAGRETEYVQLYTIEGGLPQLQAEGAWRWEDAHRYMYFPHNYDDSLLGPISVPLYETMFDSSILISGKTFMLAGTHNNNGIVWAETSAGTRACWEHYPTTYSMTWIDSLYTTIQSVWWCRFDTLPWSLPFSRMEAHEAAAINIFPILDTLFGTACAAVTGLQTVEVDSLWATLMWSADARHQEWEVKYRPADDSLGSDMVVTVTVPTVTLTGLTPGTTYSVRVRGLCDVCIENYSPWCDTLQFVTLYTPPDTTPDILPHITPFHPLGIGNLDIYTRIMPNPAHDVVNVLSSYQLKSVAVYDLTGRQMLLEPADGMTATVNVAALPRGTYILAICTLQGVATKRLLVE